MASFLGLLPLSASHACAQCAYEVTFVLGPPCSQPSSPFGSYSLRDFSDAGVVTGRYICNFVDTAFRWSAEGGIELLASPPNVGSSLIALGVNEAGAIVGECTTLGGGYAGIPLLWPAGATAYWTPPLPPDTFELGFTGILEDGTIFGDRSRLGGGLFPCVLHPDGTFEDIKEPFVQAGLSSAYCEAVNRHGAFSGRSFLQSGGPYAGRGYIYQDGSVTVIHPPNQGSPVAACQTVGISDTNVVVGRANLPPPGVGQIVWLPMAWEGGVSRFLPLLPGFSGGNVMDVNELGQMVGYLTYTSFGQYNIGSTGAVWIDGVPYKLADLAIPPGPQFSVGITSSINNRGQIAASCVMAGKGYGVILTPIGVVAGDLTIDCKVNAKDLAMLLGLWGTAYDAPGGLGDLDGDLEVGSTDLAVLFGAWTG
jgi:hypothetical protein